VLFPLQVVVFVTTVNPSQMEGLYHDACKAISDFADQVKDIVAMQKPSAW